jgi:cell division protein FtsB
MKVKVAVGLMVLIILGYTVFGEHGLIRMVRYKRQTQKIVKQSENLKAENERLRQEIERLKNDQAYIERLAREDLGMVKNGEFVYQFTGNPEKE